MVIADPHLSGHVTEAGASFPVTQHVVLDTYIARSPRVFQSDRPDDVVGMTVGDLNATLTETFERSSDFANAASPMSPGTMRCTQCDAAFTSRQELFQHVKLAHQQHAHTKGKKFRCDQCHRSFKSMTALRNHARTHTGYFETTLSEVYMNSSVSSNRDTSLLLPTSADTSATCTDTTFTILDASTANSTLVNDVTLNDVMETATPTYVRHKTEVTNSIEPVTPKDSRSSRRRSAIPLALHRRSSIAGIRTSLSDVTSPEVNILQNSRRSSMSSTQKETIAKPNSTPRKRSLQSNNVATPARGQTDTNRTSRTPSRTGKNTTYRVRDRTPLNKLKQLATKDNTPKTPRGQTKTPKNTKSTPKTPLNKKVASGKIGSANRRTPGSSKKDVLTAARKTPNSCPKTPNRNQFKCVKCGKSFVDQARLEVHYAVHVRDTPDKCGIPKQTLRRNLLQTQTEPIGTPPRPTFACKECGQSYHKQAYLDAHMKIHSRHTPHTCEICKKQFKYLSSLKAHSFVHRGEERTCTTGNDVIETSHVTRSVTAARRSVLDRSDIGLEPTSNVFSIFSETMKQKPFESEPDLPFSCKSCDYKTSAPAELLRHLKIHARVGAYTCSTCSKSFKLQSNLKTHENMHTIQKIKDILVV